MDKVQHMRFPLRGLRYRATQGTIDQISGSVPLSVRLRRDSQNPNDKNAVAIFLVEKPWADFHIGYVPRDIAAVLAPKMDSGKIEVVEATLENIEPDLEGDISITVKRSLPKKKSKAKA